MVLHFQSFSFFSICTDKALEVPTMPEKHRKDITTDFLKNVEKSYEFNKYLISRRKFARKKLPNEITNVLLLSSERSGGAFLGQILAHAFPDTFYSVNPLVMSLVPQVSCTYRIFAIIRRTYINF